MRLFIGIPLPSVVTGELAALSARLRSADDGLRWSSPESWHITLQFLGNADPEQYECIASRLHSLRYSPIAITFDGLGFFGAGNVLIAGVRTTPALLELRQHVTKATGPCGFISDSRAYHPHVTLARGKGKRTAIVLRGLAGGSGHETTLPAFNAEEFLLYESLLGPSGARYEIRKRFPLHER